MITWLTVVETINSVYRDDRCARVTCEQLMSDIEQQNLTDIITVKFEEYQKDLTPLDALIKACSEQGVKLV